MKIYTGNFSSKTPFFILKKASMALIKSDRQSVINTAKSNGYKVSSNGSSMFTNSGSKLTFSSSGGSVNVNGTKYTDASSANKKLNR